MTQCVGGSWRNIGQEAKVYAIEFEADIKNGVLRIPEGYQRLENSHARVLIMVQEDDASTGNELSLDLSNCTVEAFKGIDAVKAQREMRDEW